MLTCDRMQGVIAHAVMQGPRSWRRRFLVLEAPSGFDARARLAIHHNNAHASLAATLVAVFPVTVKPVDERYFRYAAHNFIRQRPPREPRCRSSVRTSRRSCAVSNC